MKKLVLITCLTLTAFSSFSQLPLPELKPESNLELKFYERYVQQQIELHKVLEAQKTKPIVYEPNGSIIQAMYVTATGHIVYNTTYNIGAGRTLSTNKVWPGGTVGVSLTGANMPNRLGVWDGGAVLASHQEFTNRVTQIDGASSLSDHATHVAGTMIASGVDANAKGMSYQATLKAYDWTNDDAEMTAAAAAGMLISNHSYGTITGWYYSSSDNQWKWYGDPAISTTEDYKFGFYNDDARNWDLIAEQYPNYLICKSAGNDRGDNKSGSVWYYSNGVQGSGTPPGADGGTLGYDCIPTSGNSKNILTVGAVNKIGANSGNGWTQTSDVVMSSFSGWGPTDDGRIKPDIVSPGVSVYSSVSTGNNKYDTYNGTSMASPAASGSLLLVQQHYFVRNSKYMRAATLKGLAIHTADEAGTAGPDYKHGWGLLNTASCVKLINDSGSNKIDERVLTTGVPQTTQFGADAGKPLKITICWTDKAGVPVTTSLLDNPKKMLVNDLDIKLTRISDGAVFLPYILNPANPAAAATTGDNVLDNVEQIYVANPLTGAYTITVSNKGTLQGNTQPYSIIISNYSEKIAAAFNSSATVICPGENISFEDASSGGIAQRVWYFPGGNPATSTAKNPTVTYATAGKYPVALKIIGSLGIDSVYKRDYVTVGGLALPFYETFENNSASLNSWKLSNPDNGSTWAITATGGLTPGTQSVGINLFNYSSIGQRDGLVSPSLDLSTHTNTTLSFKHAYTRYGGSPNTDSLIVYASTNCGTSWTRIATYGENSTGSFATYSEGTFTLGSQTNFVPQDSNNWCGVGVGSNCKTISLASFVNQKNVMIKFESYNNYGNNIYIDNVSVNGTPKVPVSNFTVPTQGCVNTPITFNDNSANIPTAWEWTVMGAIPSTSNLKNPTFIFPANGPYTIKLKVSNSSGSDSITQTNYITIVDKPTAPTIQANGPLSFCLGDSVLLTTDHVGNHNWYMNDILIAQNVQEIYAKQSGSYKIGVSNGTCESFADLTVTATPKPAPAVVTASITGTAFCQGNTVTLTSSANSGNVWYRNNLEISGATAKTYLVSDSGTYAVKYAINMCEANLSNTKTFSLLTKPTVDAVVGSTNPVRGETNNYTVTAVSGNTYTWSTSTNGTILSGNGTSSITARFNSVDSGTVTVQSRSTAGCLSTPSSLRVLVAPAVGLNEFDANAALRIYPIPATNILHISFDAQKAQQAEIRLVNLLGQTVILKQVSLISGENTFELGLEQLPKGVYMVEIIGAYTKAVKRITKE